MLSAQVGSTNIIALLLCPQWVVQKVVNALALAKVLPRCELTIFCDVAARFVIEKVMGDRSKNKSFYLFLSDTFKECTFKFQSHMAYSLYIAC